MTTASSGGSGFINVLIAFDAHTIVQKYPEASKDYNNPTFVDHKLIYMTTRQDRVIGEPGAELNFKARPGDVIRWRETSLSLNFDYSALLYRYMSNDKLITEPMLITPDATLPIPEKGAGGAPAFTTQSITTHNWQATVEKVGKVTYHFFFQILDGKEVKGYFRWDPFITIERR